MTIEDMAEEAGMMNDAGWWFSLDGAREDVSTEALTRLVALVRRQALEDAANWCLKVQAHHAAKQTRDKEDQAFYEGEACGAEDCVEAIRAEGDWP